MSPFDVLAQNEDGNLGKIIFPIILAVIFIINAIMSAVNKQKQEQRRRQIELEMARHGGQAPPSSPVEHRPPSLPNVILRELPTPPPLPPQRRPMPPAPQRMPQAPQQQPQVRRTPQVKQQKKKKVAVRQPVAVMEAPATRIAPVAPPMAPAKPAVPKTAAADAQSLRRWMTPATLRQQFILTEILQPPKAMRAED